MALPQGPYYVALGTSLRTARLKKGKTQEELARSVGLTRTSITNIEKGRQPMPLHVLAALAKYLEVEMQTLLPSPSLLELDFDKRLTDYPEDQRIWINKIVKKPRETRRES